MKNISNKEKCCVELAHQAKLTAAKERLADLKNNSIPFDSPVSGLAGRFTWNESLGGKIIQIVLLPLMLVFVLVSFAMTPIAYILYLRKAYKKRKELEIEIQALETESLSDEVPDEKNVESLWGLHGLDDRKFSLDERLNLLDAWIGVLYGGDASKHLGLKSRVAEIAERQVKANLACYEDKDAPHFRFASPVESLVRQVSKELSLYR